MSATPLLAVRGVTTMYGNITALRGVDLDVHQGEIVTLIGANGAGKSTLMMTIFGNPRASDGQILFEGRDITHLPTHEIARLDIAQAPEGRRIFSRMTVMENLQMGAAVIGSKHFDEDLARIFKMFPRMKERIHQRGGTLSGGEQQMLAIARALMSRPRLLLLDEPSSGMSAHERAGLGDLLKRVVSTNALIGELTEPQLESLKEWLEEESDSDQDYWINQDTVEYLAEEGADPGLVAMIRKALGDRDDMEIRWEQS